MRAEHPCLIVALYKIAKLQKWPRYPLWIDGMYTYIYIHNETLFRHNVEQKRGEEVITELNHLPTEGI
jgi:hypothetical protein